MTVRAGASSRVINCQVGDYLYGTLTPRTCRRIKDNLEANFAFLGDDNATVLLVSMDLAGAFRDSFVRGMTSEIGSRLGMAPEQIILCSTNCNGGPVTFDLLHDVPVNEPYLQALRIALLDGAEEAAANARIARVGWANGRALIGTNRRLCWDDGSHSMYGDATQSGFAGLEGPADPSHATLFAADEQDSPVFVLHNNCAHAACVQNAEFCSADYPGEARRLIRNACGAGLPVLYLQGAAGDVAPWDTLNVGSDYDGAQRVKDIGRLLADESLRAVAEAEKHRNVIVGHAYRELELSVRLPTPAQIEQALSVRAAGDEKCGRSNYALAVNGVLRLQERFKDNPRDTARIHAVRIGDFALATNPCKLFCQFGLDIKNRSPASVTAISELADGFSGYCPTIYGLRGGGYSASPTLWCRLEETAGYQMVDASSILLHSLW